MTEEDEPIEDVILAFEQGLKGVTASRPDPLPIFIDLETAGTRELYDPILEFGMVIVDAELEILSKHSWVVVPPRSLLEHIRRTCDVVVQEMHEKNGLWDDLFAGNGMSSFAVEEDIIKILKMYGHKHDFVLAGSGVSHFDRRFIKEQMPKLEKWFRYYSLDVGVLRRSLTVIGREDLLLPKENKIHRALPDALYHLEELRYVKKELNNRLKTASI